MLAQITRRRVVIRAEVQARAAMAASLRSDGTLEERISRAVASGKSAGLSKLRELGHDPAFFELTVKIRSPNSRWAAMVNTQFNATLRERSAIEMLGDVPKE